MRGHGGAASADQVLMTKFGKSEKNQTIRIAISEYPVLSVSG
jgi:hypothetical protein